MFCFCEAQIWGRRSVKLKCSSSSSLLKLECLLLKKRRGWREKGKWWQVVHRGWGAVSWDRVSPSADTCLTRGPSLAQPCWGPVCACTLGGRYVGRWPVGSQYGSWEVPRFLDKTKAKPWTPASLPKRCGAPCEKGERSRPVRSAVAVAAAGQRCGALGGLLPLLSRLRGSGAALGPGAASSPLSRTVQTCGWHVCLHPSLREFFLVNCAPFSSLPWPRAHRNDLLGRTWLVSLWMRGSHRSPSSVPMLPSRSSNSSSGPKAELHLHPLVSLLEDRLQHHGWGSSFVWPLPMSWVKQDGGEEALGLLLPQGFLPQREISSWIKLAFSAWRTHSLPSQVSDLCSCGLLHF